MKNLATLLEEKAQEIQNDLERWGLINNLLGPGEQLVFSLSVKKMPIVVQESSPNILSRSVGTLNLSVRARGALRRHLVFTLSDLISKSADDLLEMKLLGNTTLQEVREKLDKLGLKLEGD